VSKSDEFRRNADECLRMADRTADEGDRRAWLRLAESWLRMIRRNLPGTDETATAQEFEVQAKADGTRQRPSTGSH
jgi:hypothetical protein